MTRRIRIICFNKFSMGQRRPTLVFACTPPPPSKLILLGFHTGKNHCLTRTSGTSPPMRRFVHPQWRCHSCDTGNILGDTCGPLPPVIQSLRGTLCLSQQSFHRITITIESNTSCVLQTIPFILSNFTNYIAERLM